jgi:hypothetical protein
MDMARNSIWSLSLDELKRMANERLSSGARHDDEEVNASSNVAAQSLPQCDGHPEQELGMKANARSTPSA